MPLTYGGVINGGGQQGRAGVARGGADCACSLGGSFSSLRIVAERCGPLVVCGVQEGADTTGRHCEPGAVHTAEYGLPGEIVEGDLVVADEGLVASLRTPVDPEGSRVKPQIQPFDVCIATLAVRTVHQDVAVPLNPPSLPSLLRRLWWQAVWPSAPTHPRLAL
jgi:hypothetical protein